MKNLLLILPLSLAFISCSPSISEAEQRKLDKAVSKKTISFYKSTKDGWTTKKINPEKAQLVENLDFTPDEKDEISKAKMQMIASGMKDFDLEAKKILIKVNYNAPSEGIVSVNNEYFESQKLLDKYVAAHVKSKTTKKKCVKKERLGFSMYRSCTKYKTVEVKDAKKLKEEILAKYANPVTHKKGQNIHSKDFVAEVGTFSMQGNSEAKVSLKTHKREIASVK